MEGGAQATGKVSLVQRVRATLSARTMGQEAGYCRRAAVRRDVRNLLERIENLRARFPDQPEILERVLLSGHVIRLLEEARGQPVTPAQVGAP